MRQRHILVILLAFFASVLQAATVNKADALQKAQNFVAGRQAAARGAAAQTPSLQAAYDSNYFYVFNIGGDGGFVIVSGDDRTPEILGYSDAGRFDAQNIPDNMRAFLQGYADEIQHMPENVTAASRGVGQKRVAAPTRSSVSPLLTTRWNQRAPYNNSCPIISGSHAVTGCVATAMAQVMNYHKYPLNETTTIPGYSPTDGHPAMSDLASTTFDWDLMRDDYASNDVSEAATEVAKLMLYCGTSVEMGYGTSASGATTSKIVYALTHYFDYDAGAKYVERNNYNYSDWVELIYNELAAGRPMVFGGQSTGGGHAFVCDGYDEDDFFHINWGWAGSSDGYFRLSNLAPKSQGAGGSTTSDGYNMSLGATIGVQPNQNSSANYILTVRDMEIFLGQDDYGNPITADNKEYNRTNTSSNFTDVRVISYFWNYEGVTQSFDYGWRIKKGDATIQDILLSTGSEIGDHYASIPVRTLSLGAGWEDGTYQIVAICRMSGTDTWTECANADRYCIEAIINGTTMTLNVIKPNLVVNSVSGTESLVYGQTGTLTVNITNTGRSNFSGDLTLAFLNGNTINQKIGGAVIDIPAGETRNMTIDVSPTVLGTYSLIVLDGVYTNGDIIDTREVTIATPSATVSMEVSGPTVDATGSTIYGNTFKTGITLHNTSADDYRYGVTAKLYHIVSGNTGEEVASKTDNEVLASGATKTYSFEFPDLDYGEDYFCYLYYYSFSGTTKTAQPFGGYAYTIAHGFVTVDAEGNVTASAPTESVEIPSDAVAVDLRGQETIQNVIVPANMNPNVVYLLDDAATEPPTGVTGNIVKGSTAETIELTDGKDFNTPITFTARTISYTRTFTLGATASAAGGWTTIVLPFDVETVKVIDNNTPKEISWFHNADDTNGRFWVRKFVSDNIGTVTFDFTDKIEANTPYIIAVPSDSWGEEFNLVGKEIVFEGKNTAVCTAKAVTSGNNYKFVGTTIQSDLSSVFDLNDSGTTFVLGDNKEISPFRAYFKAADIAYATSALAITSPSNQTTAIGQLPAVIATPKSEAIYTLDGRRLKTAPKHGVYIMNGKKMVK